jgi:hypothetical protein
MKGGSEKIVSIGGWGAAGMMRSSFRCYKDYLLPRSKRPPNAKPNSAFPFTHHKFNEDALF